MKNTAFAICIALAGVCQAQESPQINPGVKYHQSIFDKSDSDEVSCYRIPSIVTAPNGDLIAAIDERVPSCGDLMWSKDINIIIKRSMDNGKTWTPVEKVVDFPYGRSASDPSMIVDEHTGEIFMFYNFMDLDKEKNVYYLHYVKSKDNGKTWSNPVDITEQITVPNMKYDFKFITSGRGCQTHDGKLMHTLVNLNKGMRVFASDDHGKNWYLVDKAIKPADESKVIELTDGTWMVNARVNGAGMRYVHTSTDEGKTWETRPDETQVDPGCNGCILRYTDTRDGYNKDRILLSHAESKKGRENLVVKVSYDEGKTWPVKKVIYEGPSAYSDLTVLKNGDIAVFFEKDGYKKNEVVVFSLDWLTDGEDKYKKPSKK